MENRTLEEWFSVEFPVELYCVEDEDDETGFYYFAFHPDFGHSACSAVGDSKEEAISELNLVRQDVIQHYYETGRPLPEPSQVPFKANSLQQMPLRITRQLHTRLLGLAKQSGQSLNAYVTTILTEHVTLEKAAAIIADRIEAATVNRIEAASVNQWNLRVEELHRSMSKSAKHLTLVPKRPADVPVVRISNAEEAPLQRCPAWGDA